MILGPFEFYIKILYMFHYLYVGSTGEDSDYVEFSTAEAMVAAGGDPRLQALRKRLQAKKELLKHLDRMYTSFLGGNTAASKSAV